MFIGHFAIGFASKKFAPRTSLGILFLASQLIDLLWPVLLLAGIEQVKVDSGNTVVTPLDFIHYPYSHSLLTVIIISTLLAVSYWAITRYRQGSLVLWLACMSHWVLDAISHRPDLPLYPGSSTFIGFGLWNSLGGTILLEGLLFTTGIILYARITKPKNRAGRYALWALVAFLTLTYASAIFGPPPPDDQQKIALVSLSTWLFVLWAYWIDKHRQVLD
jgi:membrane-bound metal-dependent hydrolase YbcI (DUF457 family)